MLTAFAEQVAIASLSGPLGTCRDQLGPEIVTVSGPLPVQGIESREGPEIGAYRESPPQLFVEAARVQPRPPYRVLCQDLDHPWLQWQR